MCESFRCNNSHISVLLFMFSGVSNQSFLIRYSSVDINTSPMPICAFRSSVLKGVGDVFATFRPVIDICFTLDCVTLKCTDCFKRDH